MNPSAYLDRIKNENIVLLADRVFKGYKDIDLNAVSLEMIPDEYYYEIFDCLNTISKSVTHYNTPESFINNIAKHKNDIVFTVYGGQTSRNRMALVPAICEAYNIRFVGADVYARIICQDKQISKEYCKRFGLHTANYLLVDQFTNLQLIEELDLPIVVKPNMEGSSIGIQKENLISSYNDAKGLVKEVLLKYRQPVLVEEFITGKEVCVCVSGNTKAVNLIETVEVFIPDNEKYFYTNLYTASIKHTPGHIKHRIITPDVDTDDLRKLHTVFQSLGKMDYLRIDGKVSNGKFHLIELTPDAHLGIGSSFTESFRKNGLSYKEMIATFICNALEYYQHQ